MSKSYNITVNFIFSQIFSNCFPMKNPHEIRVPGAAVAVPGAAADVSCGAPRSPQERSRHLGGNRHALPVSVMCENICISIYDIIYIYVLNVCIYTHTHIYI